jgi:hypothetical protein
VKLREKATVWRGSVFPEVNRELKLMGKLGDGLGDLGGLIAEGLPHTIGTFGLAVD